MAWVKASSTGLNALVSGNTVVTITTAAGQLVTAYVEITNSASLSGAGGPTCTVSGGASAGTAITVRVQRAGTGFMCAIFSIVAPTGMTGVTVNAGAGSAGNAYVESWTGNDVGGATDGSSTNNGTSATSGTSGSFTTTTNGDLILAYSAQTASNGGPAATPWAGTGPTLTTGLGTYTLGISGYGTQTTAGAVNPQSNWVTSRAWAMVAIAFKPQASVNLTGSATAQISHSESSVQNATTGIAASVSTNILATAQILPGSSAIKTSLISATTNVSNSVTGPLQPAASRISNNVTAQINAIAMIDPPLWSPLILMGSGNSFDQVLGSQYFELSANINGGSSANDQTYFLDGGRSV